MPADAAIAAALADGAAPQESAISRLFTYLFLSGVSKNIIVFINLTIIALILVLFTSATAEWDARMAYHAWFQLALAFGLLGAVNWWFSVCVQRVRSRIYGSPCNKLTPSAFPFSQNAGTKR
jgi:hypothetical protein